MTLISNIGLLAAEAITGEPNEKEPTFNEEFSPDNDEVAALDLTPPTNGSVAFNEVGG